MPALMDGILARALRLEIPLNAHLDLTCLCNERCAHCYVEQNGIGELATGEVRGILEQLAEAHDRITGLTGSLERSLGAIRLMRELGQKVIVNHMAMRGAEGDHPAVKALAADLGAVFRIDPVITLV
jgi:MoaA/NifB/PqqE/SkfB family radical SAM enzyme